jgi:hypothetical protein
MISRSVLVAAGVAAATLAMSAPAHAFCGFYIDGGGKKMFNDATQVVLMRRGTRTVLSMRNTYRGPVEDFAMVVPVPVVLHEGDVKTLRPEVFEAVDLMGSPRLVEYWEQDPCQQGWGYGEGRAYGSSAAPMATKSADKADKDYGVKIEAQFDVGEYNIVILSAKESTGLDSWLRDTGYNIPAKAEAALRPYVEAGSKFFVAKIDPKKVTFDGKTAVLSPLRFHYDTDSFELPIRLGLINSSGKQDLIVNILADDRYQLANYKNVTIPTNLNVKDEVRKKFPEFYAALFDRTLEKNKGAIVTEYAWAAGTCDPCPGPTLDGNDFMTLGADVIDGGKGGEDYSYGGNFVLTRLHARYGKDDAKDDLVFEKATPIVGGRENLQDNGKLEEGAVEDSYNNFQGRYIIRHLWTGKIRCKNPRRGIWGGPPNGGDDEIAIGAGGRDTAFVKRGRMKLQRVLKQSVPELGIKIAKKKKKKKVKKVVPPAVIEAPPKSGALPSPGTGVGLGLAGLFVIGGLLRRRARRS